MRSTEEIGKTVRQLRGNSSLRDFAQKCGISHTSIDTIEKGYDFRTKKPTQPKLATLSKIADACGVPLSHITGEPMQDPHKVSEYEVQVALFGGAEYVSEENWKKVQEYVEFLKLKDKGDSR